MRDVVMTLGWSVMMAFFVASLLQQAKLVMSGKTPTTTDHNLAEGVKEYCETDRFTASCQDDEVIFMERALYGRMRLGRCVKQDLGFIGCYQNVLGLANWKCSGRRHCSILIPDPDFDTTKPCLQELKTFFEASYICLKVVPVSNDTCRIAPGHANHRSGYIASITTQETGCGASLKPYIIQAQLGQRLNVTLYDFSGEYSNSKPSARCWRYAVIKEKAVARSTVICSGKERVKHVYQSTNNTLEIAMLGDMINNEPRHFLLKYDVVGCPDFDPANHMWFRRETEEAATVGCVNSAQQWRLQCVGNTWVGKMGNCSHYELVSNGHTEPVNHQMSVGTSMVIIFGIAIGIGVIVFLIGFVSFKRCRSGKARKGGQRMTLRSGYPVELELDESRREKCKQNFAELNQAQPATVGYHSLKLSGNEYTHIWETPAPNQTQVKDFLDEADESPIKERRLSHPELFFMRHTPCEHIKENRKREPEMTLPRVNRKGMPVLQTADDFSYDPPRYFLVNREVWASNVPPYPDNPEVLHAEIEPDLHSHIHPTQTLPHTLHAPHCTAHVAELAAAESLKQQQQQQQQQQPQQQQQTYSASAGNAC